MLIFLADGSGWGILICRYRISNIGKAISNVSWIWNVQKTRTQTLGPKHTQKIAEERSGDNGRDREHEPGMVETLPRIRLPDARRNGTGRTDQEKRRRKIRTHNQGERGRRRVALQPPLHRPPINRRNAK